MKKTILIITMLSILFTVPVGIYRYFTDEPVCELEIFVENEEEAIPLEEYIIGVVNGEMPASFHLEALKAQAIAARTYALYQTDFGQKPIQTTTAHQVFKQQLDPKYEEKLKQAVMETKSQIMTYNNEPISAMFHAASNGQTESAQNYSGNPVHYLNSVPSPEQYVDTTTFTIEEFNNKLQNNFQLEHINQAKFVKNSTNRVEKVTIQNQTYSGREFREKFALKSTDFSFSTEGGSLVHITTKGYGHGVGMSQYGANELAHAQKTAEEILKTYYTDIEIENAGCTNLQ